MGLRAIMVDRAYIDRSEPTAKKVGGRTIHKREEGPQFRCRLEIASTPKRTSEGMTRTDPKPQLLTGVKDSEGNPLRFSTADKIRVESRELGNATFQVDGEPEVIRKKRKVIGWRLTLHRTVEQDNDPADPEVDPDKAI